MGGLADYAKVGCDTPSLRGDEVVWRRLDKELFTVVVVVPVRLPLGVSEVIALHCTFRVELGRLGGSLSP